MSMLAEPRRKQKWSVDPRNSAWSKDDSKFGQKMLERMGWSKGKGLGKSEQGATEHIKVKVKNNSLGLGTNVYNEDNWIAHQDEFNQLLADLNNCHGQNNAEEPSQEQTQGFSLEEKSKTSKKRVHYMKFTKGKDLSNRSDTDLACIFGKRSKQTRGQDQVQDEDETSNDNDSQEEKEQDTNNGDNPPKPEADLITVTSALTMQEYFAQRMAQLKKGHGGSQSGSSSPGVSSIPQSPSASPEATEDPPSTTEIDQSKKKKKKKKKGRKNDKDEERAEEMEEPSVKEETVDIEVGGKKQKRKKKMRKEREEVEVEECSIPAAEHTAALSVDKKKHKNKETDTNTPQDAAGEHGTADEVMDAEVSDKKRKKRKRKGQVEEQAEKEIKEKKPKKDKSKKND